MTYLDKDMKLEAMLRSFYSPDDEYYNFKDAVQSLKAFIASEKQRSRREAEEEFRNKINEAWKALEIRVGASAGSATGIFTTNRFGEKFDMQVFRDEFKAFLDLLHTPTQHSEETT